MTWYISRYSALTSTDVMPPEQKNPQFNPLDLSVSWYRRRLTQGADAQMVDIRVIRPREDAQDKYDRDALDRFHAERAAELF